MPKAGGCTGTGHTGEGQAADPRSDPARWSARDPHARQRAAEDDPAGDHGDRCPGQPGSTLTNTTSTRACRPGATGTRRSATAAASMPATRTATASARCTSTQWRGSGHCSAPGCGPIAASRRRSCQSISASLSSCTTRADAEKPCSAPLSLPWSCDVLHHPGSRQEPQEIAGLAALGCTYLQLDDTSLAYLNDPAQRAYVDSIGGDGEHQHLINIRLINRALADKPSGMTVCTHLCRGNFRSSWMAEGGYDHVAEALFGELAVDGFFLEYDDARSGGFAPLRFVPKGPKKVVLGLVTTKRAALESKDELKRRIDEAAKYVPLEQLCLSPQCGFSSTVDGNALSIEEEKAKLRLVVEVAREIWG